MIHVGRNLVFRNNQVLSKDQLAHDEDVNGEAGERPARDAGPSAVDLVAGPAGAPAPFFVE